MKYEIKDYLSKFNLNSNNIYTLNQKDSKYQAKEIKLRKNIAQKADFNNYIDIIKQNHSIPVMDFEIIRFLKNVPKNGSILDIGGCWGWHWRNISHQRPDIKITIVDFVEDNLFLANRILSEQINNNIFLVLADATELPFSKELFDAVWTVQTLQHIYSFKKTINEIYRVLKKGGYFCNYSFNYQPHVYILKKFLGKKYINKGYLENGLWLERASKFQLSYIKKIFRTKIKKRYTEIIFSPEIKFIYPNKIYDLLGKIDGNLGNDHGFFSWFARQKSFHCRKLDT